MLNVINNIINILMVLAFSALVIVLSLAEGFIGFLMGMGFAFVVLIIFVFILTMLERITTGKWWFIEFESK